MTRGRFEKSLLVVGGLLLIWGLGRASTARYQEQRKAILAACEAEQKRLGITDRRALFAKYPTPEITLCRPVRVVPGGTGEIAVRGKFSPGTKFLFENDSVQVVKEALTPAEYRATVQVPAGSGPSHALLHAYAPVSGGQAQCQALYVGGRYQWEFTAQNGWRIRLVQEEERFAPDAAQPPQARYRAEFYRGADPKPFEVREMELSLTSAPWDDSYSGYLKEGMGEPGSASAEMEKLAAKMQDPNLSNQERERVMRRVMELSEKVAQEQQAMIARMQRPGYAQELERKQQEFGCGSVNFRSKPTGVEGTISCGQKVGTLQIKGTMKYLGP